MSMSPGTRVPPSPATEPAPARGGGAGRPAAAAATGHVLLLCPPWPHTEQRVRPPLGGPPKETGRTKAAGAAATTSPAGAKPAAAAASLVAAAVGSVATTRVGRGSASALRQGQVNNACRRHGILFSSSQEPKAYNAVDEVASIIQLSIP